jgi:putative sigma-54 modulation protein
MDVEFTARQVKISKTLKSSAVEGIERIAISLGKVTSAALIFKAERHLQVVEITLQSKNHSIAAKGESPSQEIALRDALAHAEHQAHRFRDKMRTSKRLPKVAPTAETRGPRKSGRPGVEIAAEVEKPPVVRSPGKQLKAAITVHSFPGRPKVVEPHLLSAAEALAIRPMTVEEAVKEAEFRDKDLLVFRNSAGELFVLHRRRDGKMELVEVP